MDEGTRNGPMKPAQSRRKGSAGEREVVKILNAAGFNAHRVPLSGGAAVGELYRGDVLCRELGVIEVKRRAVGFQQLYGWLEKADMLIVRADKKEWLLVIPLRRWLAWLVEWLVKR